MSPSVYERLYQQSTAASRGQQRPRHLQQGTSSVTKKKAAAQHSTESTSHDRQVTISSRKQQQSPKTTESVSLNPLVKHAPPPSTVPLTWNLFYTSKYDSAESIRPLSLFIQLDPHCADPTNPSHQQLISRHIIEKLFDRDHSAGKRWDYDPATVECVAPNEYQASKEATWDWKDIYAVATAQGRVCFDFELQQICIRQYSYYCAG